jgi:branched-chain amino acid transport system permease protein
VSGWRRYRVPAVALVGAAALPLLVPGGFFHAIGLNVNAMALIVANAIAAVGLNLLVGVAGQISLAHGAFMAIGGYTTAYLTLEAGLPPWLGVPLGGLVAAVVGFLLGLPALRLHGHFLALATLSFGAAVPQVALKWDAVTGGAMGLSPAGFPSDLAAYWTSLAVLAVLAWVADNLVHSRPGRALLALHESEVAAQAMGVNLARAKTGVFALSAFYAGVAGALSTHRAGFISPLDFNLLTSFQLLAAIVVGGLASITGSIAGAMLLTYLSFAFSRSLGLASTIEGLAIIAVVVFLPQGLSSLGRRRGGGRFRELGRRMVRGVRFRRAAA